MITLLHSQLPFALVERPIRVLHDAFALPNERLLAVKNELASIEVSCIVDVDQGVMVPRTSLSIAPRAASWPMAKVASSLWWNSELRKLYSIDNDWLELFQRYKLAQNITLTEHLTASRFYQYFELFFGEIGSGNSLDFGCSSHLFSLIR